MRPSTFCAAIAWLVFVLGAVIQFVSGQTLVVVDADACAALFMAWAAYVRIGESR